MRFYDK